MLLYGLVVLFDLGVQGLELRGWGQGGNLMVDFAFLTLFTVEVCIRLFALPLVTQLTFRSSPLLPSPGARPSSFPGVCAD